jgi:hypothetical protein
MGLFDGRWNPEDDNEDELEEILDDVKEALESGDRPPKRVRRNAKKATPTLKKQGDRKVKLERREKQWYEAPGVELVPKKPPAIADLSAEDKAKLRRERKDRIERVMTCFFNGWSAYRIATELDIPVGVIRRDVESYLRVASRRFEKMKDNYLQVQLARYHRQLSIWLPLSHMAYDPNGPQGGKIKPAYARVASRAQEHVSRIMTDINKLLELGTYGDHQPVRHDGPIQFNFFDKTIIGKNADGSFIFGEVMPDKGSKEGQRALPPPEETFDPSIILGELVEAMVDEGVLDDDE